jgi:hypothetical protein
MHPAHQLDAKEKKRGKPACARSAYYLLAGTKVESPLAAGREVDRRQQAGRGGMAHPDLQTSDGELQHRSRDSWDNTKARDWGPAKNVFFSLRAM